MRFQLDGIEVAIENIHNIAEAVTDEKAIEAAAEALEPIAARARELVPVRSGDLRDSIVVSAATPRGGHQSRQGGANSVFDGRTAWVGPIGGSNVFYGGFLEFGTVNMRARPFLGPAVLENEELVFEIFGEQMGNAILEAI